MKRRQVLITGAAVAGLGAAGLLWRGANRGVFSEGEGRAYEPWRRWPPDPAEGPLSFVRAAILAASPHNTQPWLFRVSDARIELFVDPKRNIGTIDPFLREMYMGLGCALENLVLGARAGGRSTTLLLMPAGARSSHVATLQLAPGSADVSALYRMIPKRHTNRGPYDITRSLAPDTLGALAGLGLDLPDVSVLWFTSDAQRKQVGELIVAATEAIIADHEQSADSARWLRMSWEALQRHRDGVTLDAAGLSPALLAAAKMLPTLSRQDSDAAWLTATRETHVGTATGYGLIVSRDAHDNAQRLQGGRLWQRMHLWATENGVAMQPLNQTLERADRERILESNPEFGTALQWLVADPAWQALMPFRLGYPVRDALPSPRRPVEEVLT